MRLGLVLTCFNRPAELRRCLASLQGCTIPQGLEFVIVDDASTDPDTTNQIQQFSLPGVTFHKIRHERNQGIRGALITGIHNAFSHDIDMVINLDSDAIVKPEFFTRLVELYQQARQPQIITGFHCVTRNANGTERHPVLAQENGFWLKSSVGGINMAFGRQAFERWILPALKQLGNWDYHTCLNSMRDGVPILCAVPSLVQHIGLRSSLGHTTAEEPDLAADWFTLELPMVTLIGVDCVNVARLVKAAQISMREIKFGDVVLLSSKPYTGAGAEWLKPCPAITSKEQYSHFVVRELYKYVNTSHALIFQHDGYVVNPQAWREDFLLCDYIGGTWWYKDGFNVGNGGFSLRTRHFMETVATAPEITDTSPEDHVLCRQYRPLLETKYNMRFATEDLANRFSIEAFGVLDKKYSGQFGFHGTLVDFTGADILHIPYTTTTKHEKHKPIPARYRRR